MSVSGATSCQLGGTEALKAYDRAYETRRNDEAASNTAGSAQEQVSRNQSIFENRPIAGAIAGSNINISA
jgi:hypothetical protein